jgi:DNA mismatch endonuclease (patch repair protein)
MPDKYTKEKRSEIMSKIRSKGTKIELKMKKALEDQGIEFKYQPKMYGTPDFLVPPNIAVFCDSSFWHGRNWKKLRKKLQKGYWRTHIEENRKRDKLVNARLYGEGYVVFRFWDYQIEKQIDRCTAKIKKTLLAVQE